jgi:hypothetical protein
MEPLWSPAVATRGNRWQMGRPQERLKQEKTVAVGCDGLPETFHGKEGVDALRGAGQGGRAGRGWRWRIHWRIQRQVPANHLFLGGLENRGNFQAAIKHRYATTSVLMGSIWTCPDWR